jgi:hypothetical protein
MQRSEIEGDITIDNPRFRYTASSQYLASPWNISAEADYSHVKATLANTKNNVMICQDNWLVGATTRRDCTIASRRVVAPTKNNGSCHYWCDKQRSLDATQ